MKEDISLTRLVRDVKRAIYMCQEKLLSGDMFIDGVKLELNTCIEKNLEGEGKIRVIPLGVSGHYTKSELQKIELSFKPSFPTLRLMGNIQDELYEAVELINRTVREAAETQPVFELQEAVVSLKFGVTKGGKISVFAAVSGEKESFHTVKLVLKRK